MVYIDNMNAPFRGMKMSHMVTDSTEELLEMADRIGVNRKWIQKAGTWEEHFDVCVAKNKKALALGAQEITRMQLGRMIARRPDSPFQQCEDNAKGKFKKGNPVGNPF